MIVQALTLSPFAQNTRILFDPDSKAAVVIDPAAGGADGAKIVARLTELAPSQLEIWLTHAHLDHCGGVKAVQRSFKAQLYGHKLERELRANVKAIANMYGAPPEMFEDCPEPDTYIDEGDILFLGVNKFELLFTPGHAPGHICFYCREEGLLICGDTVFAGSIGRTDLPGGNHDLLMESIRTKILTLPDTTRLLPGHGPDTTVSKEKASNPFLK